MIRFHTAPDSAIYLPTYTVERPSPFQGITSIYLSCSTNTNPSYQPPISPINTYARAKNLVSIPSHETLLATKATTNPISLPHYIHLGLYPVHYLRQQRSPKQPNPTTSSIQSPHHHKTKDLVTTPFTLAQFSALYNEQDRRDLPLLLLRYVLDKAKSPGLSM